MDKDALLDALRCGQMDLQGQFTWGSNYTFLASIRHGGLALDAVYKPLKGEMPLWDFPFDSLAGREVAAFLVSEALGWELVPPTVIREDGPFGRGSLQVYITHDPELTYFNMDAQTRARLRPAAVFDLLLNNADRKGSHVLLDGESHIWLIDHGLCFHTQPKLRTVMWEFNGEDIPAELLADMRRLHPELKKGTRLRRLLREHLSAAEVNALRGRVEHILNQPRFPAPDPDRRPYPWPLV